MAVRFIVGHAGSGKTHWCFSRIVDSLRRQPLGPMIYWIVPKQATFSAERELTCNSGLDGFCRARVLSFDELSNEILAECGGGAIPQITTLGRQMLIGHLLRKLKLQLKFFSNVAHQPGLAARLDATFSEFERSGQEPSALDDLSRDLESSDDAAVQTTPLLDKLHDFRVLYGAYASFLGQERLDQHRRLNEMLSCMDQSQNFAGSTIYIDSFHDFTEHECRTIARLARIADDVAITLLIDPESPTLRDIHRLPDDLSLFHSMEHNYRRLVLAMQQEQVKLLDPVVLRDTKRFKQPALNAIERSLFDGQPQSAPSDGIEMIEAGDRRAEADAVARRIRDLVLEGVRYRDMAVLLRDLDPYHEIIDASFHEHRIPYFVDRRRTAAHHPLLQFIRSALAIARQDWPHDAVMNLLKCGLAGISPDETDELENYILLHRIRGPVWAQSEDWEFRRKLTRGLEDEPLPEDRIELKRINAIRRRIVDRLKPFIDTLHASQPRSVRAIVVDLFTLLDEFEVRDQLVEWIHQASDIGELEQRGEHEQVWAEFVELFDQMVDLLGDEQVSLADFIEIVEAGLDQFTLALTPPTLDQVLVGQVDRTRTGPLHTCFVMGLNDGQFPKTAREDAIISDSERRALRNRRIDLEPETERRLLDESLLGYIAFTRSFQRLILTRSLTDDKGRTLGPSIFWNRVRQHFPQAEVQTLQRSDHPHLIGTPRQMITSLMRWAREESPVGATPASPCVSAKRTGDAGSPPAGEPAPTNHMLPSTGVWPALYQWLSLHPYDNDALDVMRFNAWKALSYDNAATLSPPVAARLFSSPLNASVTRIETFATCPFKHFVSYGLKLQEREDADVTKLDLGNVFHQILEKLVRELLSQRADWGALQEHVTGDMIRKFADQIGKELRGELMLSSAKNKYLLQRIEKTLNQVLAAQQAMMKRCRFRPAAAEVAFGLDNSDLPPLSLRTPGGRQVLLHGKIDRVDLLSDEGAFAVIDYKLTGKPLRLDRVYHGISLQLLTYMLVLQANGEKLFGKKLTPAAAFYIKLLRNLEEVKHPEDAVDPQDQRFHLRIKPRGIFDGQHLPDLDDQCQTGTSDVVQAFVTKDGDFGKADSTDVAATQQLRALLKHVEQRVAMLADKLISGMIDASPYSINRDTPCPYCAYRSVCRFEPALNHYQILPQMKRSDVLERVTNER